MHPKYGAMGCKDLDIFHYKVRTTSPNLGKRLGQLLGPDVIVKRLKFTNIMYEVFDTGFNCGNIVFSDKAHFWLDGYVNRENYRILGGDKPEFVVVQPLYPQKVTA